LGAWNARWGAWIRFPLRAARLPLIIHLDIVGTALHWKWSKFFVSLHAQESLIVVVYVWRRHRSVSVSVSLGLPQVRGVILVHQLLDVVQLLVEILKAAPSLLVHRVVYATLIFLPNFCLYVLELPGPSWRLPQLVLEVTEGLADFIEDAVQTDVLGVVLVELSLVTVPLLRVNDGRVQF